MKTHTKREYHSPQIERIDMDFEVSLTLESPTGDPEPWGKQMEGPSTSPFKDELT